MEINEFRTRLKSGELSGWYLFSGEEEYLKKHYLGELYKAVVCDEAFALFNYTAFDGADIDFASVSEALRSSPMMGDYKLVVWRFADIDSLKDGDMSALESLFSLKEEYPCAIFVISTTADGYDEGTVKKMSATKKRLLPAFEHIAFPKSTEPQLQGWLKKHFDAEGVTVDPSAVNALLLRSGRSMEVLSSEVEKLAAYVRANGRDHVTAADVEYIASPSAEGEAFALSNAVMDRNSAAALLAIADLKSRRVDPHAVLAILETTFSDLATIAMLTDEGKRPDDISLLLPKFRNVNRVKIYVQAAKRIGTRTLAENFTELCRIDAASKTSGGLSGYGPIEMFVAQKLQP